MDHTELVAQELTKRCTQLSAKDVEFFSEKIHQLVFQTYNMDEPWNIGDTKRSMFQRMDDLPQKMIDCVEDVANDQFKKGWRERFYPFTQN